MLNKTEIYKIIEDSKQFKVNKVVIRKKEEKWIKEHLESTHVKILTGFRRVGKSFLLKLLSQYLIEEKKVSENNIFFLNFEHPLLIKEQKAENLYKIFELFAEECIEDEKIYLFLDEIQNVKDWEKFVRILHEKGKEKYNIYITGSNSSLLSSEFSSALGGRTVELKIYPFNFSEVLEINNLTISNERDYVKNRDKVEKFLNMYLKYGGLPEIADYNQPRIGDYIEGIVNKVLLDDIIKRYEVDKADILKNLFRYIVTMTSSITTASSIERWIENKQKISSPTINKYLTYLKSAYAIEEISRFDWKSKNIFDRLQKYYPIDNSFLEYFSLDKKEMLSKNLECVVFNNFNRLNTDIWYGRDTNSGKEIDFIVKNHKHKFVNVQVTWELNEDNRERELNNFKLINKYISKSRNLLIVKNGTQRVHNLKNTTVEEIPLWYFLINYRDLI